MMGTSDPQPSLFYNINLEQFVTSERALVRELNGNMVLRWFVGLDLDKAPWDHSTFTQNRKRHFDKSGVMEKLFDQTVDLAIQKGLISDHATLDGTLVKVNASHKSFVPIEVFMKPKEYKKRIRMLDQDEGNPTVDFHGEKRSNKTHISKTDPDAKLANKGNGTTSMVGYTVNGLMENRNRILIGINVETFRGPASETEGGRKLIDDFHGKHEGKSGIKKKKNQ